MGNGLPPGSIRHALLESPGFDGLALLPEHNHHDRDADSKNQEREGTVSPAEIVVSVEQIGNPGTSKGARDRRGVVETKDDHAVLQSSHVGQHNVNDIHHTEMSNPVQSVGSDIGFNVLASGLHDLAENDDQEHEGITLNAAPDINDLGESELGGATENGRHHAGTGQKAVSLEQGGNIGIECSLDRCQEHVDE